MTHQVAPPPEFSSPDMFPISDDYRQVVTGVLGSDWTVTRSGSWYMCRGPHTHTIDQGWKIHVSSTPPHAEGVLTTVSRYCGDHAVAFKFCLDPTIHGLMNGKMWPRGGAGKFVTIYPTSEAQFKTILEDLYPPLQRFSGPYILSDRRYRDSRCLYYRYGGIMAKKKLGVGGVEVSVLRSPDGDDYEDQRNPYYVAPPWVTDPFGQDEPVADPEEDIVLGSGRYRVTSALDQTTRGGAYLAQDTRSGEQVVIKEARPGTAWLDGVGDAVAQLRREAQVLQELESTGVAPRHVDSFFEWENYFLVQEYVSGRSLASLKDWHIPPQFRFETELHRRRYLEKTARLWRAMMRAMQHIHELGYVVGDVSPSNIVALDESLETVRFIDLECAVRIGEPSSVMRTPGFASKDDQQGAPADVADDYYGLAASLLCRLIITSQLVTWSPDTYARLLNAAARRLGIHGQTEPLVDVVAGRRRPDQAAIERLGDVVLEPGSTTDVDPFSTGQQLELDDFELRLQECIVASLRYPDAEGIPVTPAAKQVFSTNRYCVAYGAAGIVRALPEKQGVELGDWLAGQDLEAQVRSPGLYTGLAGIAWTFLDLDRRERAIELMDVVVDRSTEGGGDVSLLSGAAGVGLTSLHFFASVGDERYLQHARRMAALVERGLQSQTIDNVNPGLTGGVAGLALFLLYLSRVDESPRFAEIGRDGLTKILHHVSTLGDGDGLQAPMDPLGTGSGRVAPYWESGSAGLGTVCLRYGVATGDEEMLGHARELARGCANRWVLWPTFASGLAGLGMYLLDCAQFLPEERDHWYGAAAEAAGLLTLYRVDHDGLLHMPGESLRTVSCDLFTGSAGTLLFVSRLLNPDENRTFLPDHLLRGAS